MEQHQPSVFIYPTHAEAEQAIRILDRAGFDIKQLSIIGKGYHSEEHPVGFYTTGEKIKTWGGVGAFWGGLWGLLFAPAVFLLPGVGLVAMAGPVVTTLVSALEGAVVVGGVSAIAAALSKLGVKKADAVEYESALKADKYVLLVHGSAEQQEKASSILSNAEAWKSA
ncbi:MULTISPECIES: hypothetical protein [Aquitalea]|jgi:hypothetical protein|uniref:Uncharacterized protein n=1 Tax=Aquitalea magnusonii TaxID=332411 RepID=A0A318JQQ8_9NEIS|nr:MULTISPECIES: hypothetical protein [Aquitalea]PXX50588.1 hypothetical protein DFR38_102245 [Aquitalea magnusonii]